MAKDSKNKAIHKKLSPRMERVRELEKSGHVVLHKGKDWLDTFKRAKFGGNEITSRDYSYNWKGHKDYIPKDK